jgi:threonine/homoserine/homoserine lactone efflux protein
MCYYLSVILFKGVILGFLIAASIGPIAMLCIQRTLSRGRISGFVSGLGAATADGLYGAVAAFGLGLISSFLIDQQFIFRLVGGAFLLYIGVRLFNSKPKETTTETKTNTGLVQDYISTLFLTITNPMTIIFFTAIFASAGLGFSGSDYFSAALLSVGVFLGSALWWFVLSFGVAWIKTKIAGFSLEVVNKISGVVIVVFALVILVNVLM